MTGVMTSAIRRSFMVWSVLLLAVLAAGGTSLRAYAATDPALVPGNPPLTQPMVYAVADFYGFVLDAPLTRAQEQELQDQLVSAWQAGDQDTIGGVLDMLDVWGHLQAAGEAEQARAAQDLRGALLAYARQGQDWEAHWTLAVYDAAHRPIAPGTPPLTRQASDALAEVLVFMVQDLQGQPPFVPDGDVKDAFAQALAQAYPGATRDGREALAAMPAYWAAVRHAWSTLSAAEREQLRAPWRVLLTQLQAGPSSAGSSGGSSSGSGAGSVAPDPRLLTMNVFWQTQQLQRIISGWCPAFKC